MPRYIAFLRAINVGGHTLKMEKLRALFEALGFVGVETFIASGNVIFEAPEKNPAALEKKIEKHLGQELGYEVATLIRTPRELAQIAEYQPFPEELLAASTSLYISFLPSAPDEGVKQKVEALCTEVDEFYLHGRELYWLCRKKLTESLVSGAQLNKALGVPSTMRNATTVRKLAAKYSSR
jgi:uncharacterized protein (DUF1697 family)